jgi:hypothetical protein
VTRSHEGDLAQADVLLQQAGRYADHGFFWWRGVREKLDKIRGTDRRLRLKPRDVGDHRVSRRELQARFAQLEKGDMDEKSRGKEFEKVFLDLLRITPGIVDVLGSHDVLKQSGGDRPRSREVDAAFRWRQSYYRVELKWEDRRIGPDPVGSFFSRLQTPGVSGLYVSMSGFTNGAVDEAWECAEKNKVRILLVDGDEIRLAIGGCLPFGVLLENKEVWFSKTGKPYVCVVEAGKGETKT